MGEICASPAAGIGESGTPPGGIRGRIRAVQSGPNKSAAYNGSGGGGAIDAHMGGCGGCVTSGGRAPHGALDPGGKRRACRARGPRGVLADMAHPDARFPRGGPPRACAEAPRPRDDGAPPARPRRAMEVMRAGTRDRAPRGWKSWRPGSGGSRRPRSRSCNARRRSRPTTPRGAPRAAPRRSARQAGRSRAPRGHAARPRLRGARHDLGGARQGRGRGVAKIICAAPRPEPRAGGGGRALTSCAARCRLTSKPKPRLATATAPRSHA